MLDTLAVLPTTIQASLQHFNEVIARTVMCHMVCAILRAIPLMLWRGLNCMWQWCQLGLSHSHLIMLSITHAERQSCCTCRDTGFVIKGMFLEIYDVLVWSVKKSMAYLSLFRMGRGGIHERARAAKWTTGERVQLYPWAIKRYFTAPYCCYLTLLDQQ